jgi:CBS domain-containing protein
MASDAERHEPDQALVAWPAKEVYRAMSWTVASVMTADVVTVTPADTYKDVAGRLRWHRVSAVPVVDPDGRVLGMVSEADLLLKEERPATRPGGHLLDPHGDAARAKARNVAALMTSPAVTVGADATLTEAARVMRRRHVKRLPVVDSSGRLVGIVSRGDLLLAFTRSDKSIARELTEDVLSETLAIDQSEVGVAVEDGVVRLEGEVETRSLARIVVRLVGAVEGVVAVDDRLRWRVDDSGTRPGMNPLALKYAASERE